MKSSITYGPQDMIAERAAILEISSARSKMQAIVDKVNSVS